MTSPTAKDLVAKDQKSSMKKILFIVLLLPFIAFAQDSGKKKAYYFYGSQCPHCFKVDEYFQSNGIYDKYDITKLEVTENPFNAKTFMEFGKSFGKSDWGGVPTIVFENKYLIGDAPIIDNFEKEIANVPATELPDPGKISGSGSGENQENQANQENKEKKKDYAPIVVGALIVVFGGALVFVNRKKA
jgi:glutaredoxin-related protein